MPAADQWTDKAADMPSDLFPKPNGGTCEYCGGQTIDRCVLCGAPQCCPLCCFEEIYNPIGSVL